MQTEVSILSERRGKYAPFGLEGGESGQKGRNLVVRSNGEQVDLGGKSTVSLVKGEKLRIESPGAGGYGAAGGSGSQPAAKKQKTGN